jgi:hypothetical protein
VNTYFVIPEYELKDGSLTHYMSAYTDDYPVSLTQEEAKRVVIHRILLAKKEGLAVVFVPDYPSLFNVGRSNYDINALEPKLEDVALEWAKVAEEYQVEYFAPTNEYEHLLYSNDYSLQEVYSKTNSYYERITPKIRSIYSGKVVYKCGNVGDWKDFKGLSMKGADLFGVGNAYAYAPNQVAADVEDMVKAADEVYERDKTPWFISEFLVFTKEDKINIFRKVETDLPMDKYYTPALNIFKSSEKHAVGFSFMGWTGTGRIRNTTAVPVVKQFYKELLQ